MMGTMDVMPFPTLEVEVVVELSIPGVQDTDKDWGSPKMSASEG